jgi:WD40 repeat protein
LLAIALAGWLLERRGRDLSAVVPAAPQRAERPVAPPPPAAEAERAWLKVLEKVKGPKRSADEVRRELLAFRVAHPGTEQGLRAAEMVMKLPSPLDQLKAEEIPATHKLKWFPKEVVAVLGERQPLGKAARCVAFSPDGTQVARGGDDGQVRRWETGSLQEPDARLSDGTGAVAAVWSLAYSPDGRTLAAGGNDGSVRLWDAASGAPRGILKAHNGLPVSCLAFAPDGKTLATGGWDGLVRLWQLPGGRLAGVLPGELKTRVFCLAFAPDGKVLACGREDGKVRLWAAAGAQEKPLAVYEGNAERVKVVAFSPDGRLVLSGGGDGGLRLCRWDGKALRECKVLDGHRGMVNGVAFAPDGKTMASAGQGGDVRLWDVREGRELRAWVDPNKVAVNWVAFAPDGRHLATANANSTVHILRLVARAPQIVSRPPRLAVSRS